MVHYVALSHFQDNKAEMIMTMFKEVNEVK
jgi:hypothetical protein